MKINFDKFLKRGSQLSQIILVVIATFGYFYTVVPVFEKEKLNEELLKAQNDLEKVKTNYNETYKKYRSLSVGGFVFTAGIDCTGLLEPTKPLPSLGQPLPKEVIVTINTGQCLKDTLANTDFSQSLNSKDVALLTKKVTEVASKLTKKYNTSKLDTYSSRSLFYKETRSSIQDLDSIQWD